MKSFKRQFLRAPFLRDVLYSHGEYYFKARAINISEGGILIGDMPSVPENNKIHLMFELPDYPHFQDISPDNISFMKRTSFKGHVLYFNGMIVRSFEGMSDVQKSLVQNIGLEFISGHENNKEIIQNYVNLYQKNIKYLLTLFENAEKNNGNVESLRSIVEFLGHDKNLDLPTLRLKIIRDYQSLK